MTPRSSAARQISRPSFRETRSAIRSAAAKYMPANISFRAGVNNLADSIARSILVTTSTRARMCCGPKLCLPIESRSASARRQKQSGAICSIGVRASARMSSSVERPCGLKPARRWHWGHSYFNPATNARRWNSQSWPLRTSSSHGLNFARDSRRQMALVVCQGTSIFRKRSRSSSSVLRFQRSATSPGVWRNSWQGKTAKSRSARSRMNSMRCARQGGASRSSESRKMTNSPRALATPKFLAAGAPDFSVIARYRTRDSFATSDRICSAV